MTHGGSRRLLAPLAACALATVMVVPAAANTSGFKTSRPAMVKPGSAAPAGVVIDPIVTVGESVRGFTFDSIPDGISFIERGSGRVDLYVNHETSLVPFPLTPLQFDDFTNSHVDVLSLNQHSAGILKGGDAIPSTANYQRFCSNFLAGPEQGFDRRILFANEEATDVVNRAGLAWPADIDPNTLTEQAGLVVALDVKSGEYRPIYGMGRHNHENSVALPGYEQLVIWSGDDTFSAPASQMYSYVAGSTAEVWNDRGTLYAFRSNDGATNDYGDLSVGESVSGTFIPVPRAIAVGDQNALEGWSNTNNVFQFIRIEDIAYDRNDPHIVYAADTGEPRAVADATTGRLRRGPSGTMGAYPNGRIFKFVLDPANPLKVTSLSILHDADAAGPGVPGALHQPDNLETTANSLLIQEDPGGHNQFALSNPAGVGARVWRYDLSDGTLVPVLEVDQSLDETPGYDVDPTAAASRGAWESSGIIDASDIWGEGWFLIDVQAGSLILESVARNLGGQAVQLEREGGQLLRVRIPGA